jgi:GH25 family lysozyme M1 (1,4-beta-N-acetylmuramidase)
MASAGLVRMAYHYGHPKNDPVVEADWFVDALDALQPTDMLVLDLETGDGLTQDAVNAWAKVWAEQVTVRAGRRPVLYCGHVYMENRTGQGLNGPYGAWFYPRYPNAYEGQAVWPTVFNPTLPSPNAWGGPPNFWQFSSTVPTAQGSLDADVFNGTLNQLRALNQA